uniref:Glutamine-dependent NAD(+) synthetase n=1 Tax=Candidatus Kentrum sp. SD TaxID=2126332 RepID=A0A451BPV4_9GAMM|nr:MAG: NAD+ synthase (glutamine-hydrolysing) [Candidatus Kentron sp. SD]VFK47981.1 MAG: NAD+ synthase (glutamine-hydrolysing) [Candidatus Kentron sp. SD]VFK80275.1 MAG: NAD+ synthase (glutamine-hydrolysing) [Candidatus Kentron sp. SD]
MNKQTRHPAFFNLHTHGLIRVAVGVPTSRVADPPFNAARTREMVEDAAHQGASLVLFPELGLSGYAIDDLLHQSTLLDAVEQAVAGLCAATRDLKPLIFVGAPARAGDRLYNAALALHRGRLISAFPKTYLPNYREFYEKRHFASGGAGVPRSLRFAGWEAPFGSDILLDAEDMAGFVVHAEICEDLWAPAPPSVAAALAGARVLVNLSASNVTVGKSAYRHALAEVHSARLLAAYLYSAAGHGESTTDLAWDGQAMIHENGELLAEAKRFATTPELIFADIDLERLGQERQRQTSFGDAADMNPPAKPFRRVAFRLDPDRTSDPGLRRSLARFPFVPNDPTRLSELCYEAYNIQSQGLRQRVEASGIKRAVIGISGGLDSTQALLVAAHAFDQLGLPRKDILAYTLPGFATSSRTRDQAHRLMRALEVNTLEIDITQASRQMLNDIGHPFARGEPIHDITFENVQAGARTSILFRLANHHNAIVLGTGDLSELALGWCTYGVGDHMSHYNVNASVSKTLIQHLIRWVAHEAIFGADLKPILLDILATEISPELVPGDGDAPAQRTEDHVGPYALQDFNLYYTTRFGFGPSKIAFLAWHAWRDMEMGPWPPGLPQDQRKAYDLPTILRWLRVFVHRFFATSQFKRSAVPNGPKISSGGSLSPRGDWRAPSDSSALAWMAELDAISSLGTEKK